MPERGIGATASARHVPLGHRFGPKGVLKWDTVVLKWDMPVLKWDMALPIWDMPVSGVLVHGGCRVLAS